MHLVCEPVAPGDAVDAAKDGTMQIVSNVALITVNETLVVQLVSFLLFLFIINRVMFRPLRTAIQEREFHVERLQNEIKEAEAAYDNALNRLREQEASVREAAFEVNRERLAEAESEAADILQAARTEINALRRRTQAQVDQQLDEARKHLAAQTAVLADAIVAQLLQLGGQR